MNLAEQYHVLAVYWATYASFVFGGLSRLVALMPSSQIIPFGGCRMTAHFKPYWSLENILHMVICETQSYVSTCRFACHRSAWIPAWWFGTSDLVRILQHLTFNRSYCLPVYSFVHRCALCHIGGDCMSACYDLYVYSPIPMDIMCYGNCDYKMPACNYKMPACNHKMPARSYHLVHRLYCQFH